MSKRTPRALGLGVVSLAMGCSAIAGLGTDYTIEPGSDAGARDAAAGESSTRADGDLDDGAMPDEGSVSSDAAAEASACPTDCASPLPTGAGWSLVAYNPSSTAACPASYSGAQETLLSVSAEPYTCQCSCEMTAAPTCGGVFYLSSGATCTSAGPTDPSYPIPPTANPGTFDGVTSPCGQQAFSFQPYGTSYYGYDIEPVTASAGTCQGTSKPMNPSAPELSKGEACGVATSYACACPPAAPSGWSRCAMSTSPTATCPSGLTTHTLNMGGSVHDGRACGGCASCSVPDPECVGDLISLDFYTDTACGAGKLTFGGACNGPGAEENTQSYTVSFSMDPASCKPGTDATASGSVTMTGGATVTLCCE